MGGNSRENLNSTDIPGSKFHRDAQNNDACVLRWHGPMVVGNMDSNCPIFEASTELRRLTTLIQKVGSIAQQSPISTRLVVVTSLRFQDSTLSIFSDSRVVTRVSCRNLGTWGFSITYANMRRSLQYLKSQNDLKLHIRLEADSSVSFLAGTKTLRIDHRNLLAVFHGRCAISEKCR